MDELDDHVALFCYTECPDQIIEFDYLSRKLEDVVAGWIRQRRFFRRAGGKSDGDLDNVRIIPEGYPILGIGIHYEAQPKEAIGDARAQLLVRQNVESPGEPRITINTVGHIACDKKVQAFRRQRCNGGLECLRH